jgi:anti-sigma-K factor RskA
MNIRDNPALREKLAAEYVIGTLKGGARRRFQAWLLDDAELRRITAEWQERIGAIGELAPAATPPERVWIGIERRLGLQPPPPAWQFWRRGSGLWQGLALASTAFAIVLGVALNQRIEREPAINQVATLLDDKSEASLVVTADARNQVLLVKAADRLTVPSDKTLHLWAISRQGKPRSLGILPDNRSARLALDQRAIGPDVMLLAVSLEPKGGSPDPNGPTGPVLFKGAWVSL